MTATNAAGFTTTTVTITSVEAPRCVVSLSMFVVLPLVGWMLRWLLCVAAWLTVGLCGRCSRGCVLRDRSATSPAGSGSLALTLPSLLLSCSGLAYASANAIYKIGTLIAPNVPSLAFGTNTKATPIT